MKNNINIDDLRETFEDFITDVKDPRMSRKQLHSLNEILFLVLCAIICGCEGWRDIERYGKTKVDFLRLFYRYNSGIPSDDTIRRLMRRLSPEHLKSFFEKWLISQNFSADFHIAIDGKISRNSSDGHQKPLHTVTAYASESRLILAQQEVTQNSNEIVYRLHSPHCIKMNG